MSHHKKIQGHGDLGNMIMITMKRKLSYLPLVMATALVTSLANSSALASETPKYVVEDGKADKATFNGYRRFHGTCHACHGQDAMGSSFAPSLVESLKSLSWPDFEETVTEGRQATDASGAASAMPAFGEDPNVMKHLDDIFRYLTARADGVLDAGRPPKIKVKK